MAKITIAQVQAALEAEQARSNGLAAQLAELQSRIKHDYVERAEYSRVQRLLTTTQQFLDKYKREARGIDKPVSERKAAMLAAREEAMRTGRCVAVQA